MTWTATDEAAPSLTSAFVLGGAEASRGGAAFFLGFLSLIWPSTSTCGTNRSHSSCSAGRRYGPGGRRGTQRGTCCRAAPTPPWHRPSRTGLGAWHRAPLGSAQRGLRALLRSWRRGRWRGCGSVSVHPSSRMVVARWWPYTAMVFPSGDRSVIFMVSNV